MNDQYVENRSIGDINVLMKTRKMKDASIIKVQQEYINKIKRTKEKYYLVHQGMGMVILPKVFPPYVDGLLMIESMDILDNSVVLDACSGSGIIALHASRKAKIVYATDINRHAVENINENIALHGLHDKVKAFEANIFPPHSDIKFDIITINPPYTNHKASDIVEKSVWDEGHKSLKYFFGNVSKYVTKNGKIYLGWADFADIKVISSLCQRHHLKEKIIGETNDDKSLFVVFEISKIQTATMV